ncbi:MAG TPA: excinuclease ABC subunit UvrC [Salinivirgaceae bacterium]|nr:excinuclease ABC subunit UvrC [Salinivirgaceae bacterium]
MLEILKDKVRNLPEVPGVYQFFDKNGTIIYIGKAKNLRKRVLSYFTKNHDSTKLNLMVNRIAEIRHIVVDTEIDALLLENNLVKKYQPRYNVRLKDDKTYPWIKISKEPFPRVEMTREISKDGSEYFGPYTSGLMVKSILEFLRKTYNIRTCKLTLTEKNIREKKFSVCLEYHLGNCKGPCEGLQTEESYLESISQLREVLKGNISEPIEYFRNRMMEAAAKLNFEEAEQAKQKMLMLEKYQSRSTVVNPSINNVDVFSCLDEDGSSVFVNFLKVIHGSIVQSYTFEIQRQLDESREDILLMAIVEARERFRTNSNEIVVPFWVDYPDEKVKITVPQRGDKKKLIELSEKNARYYKLEQKKQKEKINPQQKLEQLLQQMQKELRLPTAPRHIECFDNSNLQGTNPVASCVVFRNAKPSKKEYRKFHVKTVEGPDDFASMYEIVLRRYGRMLEEEQPLPDLIVIDGGKGQLNAALSALQELGIDKQTSIVSIAKRLEEIFTPNDPVPLYIEKNSPTLKVIQHIRNEAHRFGITFHRKTRSKHFLESSLDGIKGIGPITKQKLLQTFKSVESIKQASIEELIKTVGNEKAKIIHRYFSGEK